MASAPADRYHADRGTLMPPTKVIRSPRDQAIAQIRRLMGHAVLDQVTSPQAGRETFSSPGAESRLVEAAAKIVGSESVFRRISKANSVGDLLGCTIEIRFALAFDALCFEVEFLPPGKVEGPDLLVSRDGTPAYVEIRRIGQPHPRRLAAVMQSRGGEENVKKIEDELRGKFRQVRAV